jgi:hypothetical protein
MISIQVFGVDEVVFRFDQIPKQLRDILKAKFENIFSELTSQFFEGTPGKFLDPKQVQSGISELGSQLVGYIEYSEKSGVYAIYPSKSPFLYNRETGFFAYQVLRHPFPKGVPMIERLLRDTKPWIEDQLEDMMIEGL